MKFNKYTVKSGNYQYTRPNWDRSHTVKVITLDGSLYVKFLSGYYPTKLTSIPEDAVFTKRKQ